MPHLVTQTIASISDPDIEAVEALEPNLLTKEYLVLDHAPLDMNVMPSFSVAGHAIEFGDRNSNATYKAVRVSDIQTVIQRSVYPIGEGVLGVNFTVQ